MLNKQKFLQKFPGFTEGIKVKSSDDANLGKVVDAYEDYFVIEKGLFFPKDFTVRYEDVADLREGTLYLQFEKAALTEWCELSYAGWSDVDELNREKRETSRETSTGSRVTQVTQTQPTHELSSTQSSIQEEAHVPLVEEQLEPQRTLHQVGAVKLRKVVHTEFKRITVPVMKEEVRVERVAATRETLDTTRAKAAFQEETITIPVREEEITIQKKPVVKEEIRVTKEKLQRQQEVAGEIRKEDVEIEKQGDVKKPKVA